VDDLTIRPTEKFIGIFGGICGSVGEEDRLWLEHEADGTVRAAQANLGSEGTRGTPHNKNYLASGTTFASAWRTVYTLAGEEQAWK
jgi:hypothetical protein